MPIDTISTESVLGLAEAMTNMDGDAELLEEIIEIFMATAPLQMDTLEQEIADQDVQNVAINAHALKGGASNFCARQFVASALKLETLAKGGSLDGADEMLAQMRRDFTEVSEVVQVVNWQEVARSWQG